MLLFSFWGVSGRCWRRQWQPTPVLLPGKSHGQRSLVGCSPWGCWESDTTERLHFHFSLSCIGEGNGKPLQCSCLENPRNGEAWWAAVYGAAQSQIRLKRLSSSSSRKVLGGHMLELMSKSLPFSGMVVDVTHRICWGRFCWVLCSTPCYQRTLSNFNLRFAVTIWFISSSNLSQFLFLNQCVCLISLSTQPTTHQTYTDTHSLLLLILLL